MTNKGANTLRSFIAKIFHKVRSPPPLFDICVNNILDTHLYQTNFSEFNRCLPYTIKKILIHELMSNDRRDEENREININNWLIITEQQFGELLCCDKNVSLYDPGETYKLIWCEYNGECHRCAIKQPIIRTNKIYEECSICEYETYKTYSVENLNAIIFDKSNWCKKCLIVPLFNIEDNEENACRFCHLIHKYGDDAVELMVLKYGFERVQNLIY
ncbi:hypothetical protein [Orgyia leucostigma nucleopolyhedrovirus]|uniref:Uncharacterized protein n=1 Tax=Orgyia leucostigma nucleopolyhedrovirus TaxID=490711 RepID=B0FDP3_9ABAC|nr:hypothetical protein [Orgyia leucostigma nucleopolyhedrovirus]ABY65751.1 hypothetical protein [Orgyia leucostigma nucleopolyhedrovirus]